MLKIFYKVFNESDFLKESLQSVYPYADEIIVMEYCLDSMRKVILPSRVTDRGLSVDGTTQIIKSFPDPDKKIKYLPVGFIYGGENIPYQMILDLSEVGDYIWVMDGDIVYPKQLCEKIRDWVNGGTYSCIWIPERVFYHDLWHEKHLFFAHHQRIFRNPSVQAFYFPRCFEVHWIDVYEGVTDKGLYFYGRDAEYEQHGKRFNSKYCDPQIDGFAFHYAYVRGIQRTLEKLLWQYNMIDRRWDNAVERTACKKFGRDPLEFKIMTHDYFLNHEPEHRRRFNGKHPDVMFNNKWMDYYWDEKSIKTSYDEARKLVGDVGRC